MARTSREGLDGTVLASPEGVRRELQSGDPTLRSPFQRRDLLPGEVKVHRAAEELRRLFEVEAQVGGTKLDEPSPGAQPGER